MQTYNYIKSNYNNKSIVAIKTVEVAPAVSKVKEKCQGHKELARQRLTDGRTDTVYRDMVSVCKSRRDHK